MQTMREFVDAAGVKIDATPVPENPNMDSMPAGSCHYHVTLTCGDRSMATYYSVGPGIVESWVRHEGPSQIRARLANLPSRTVAAESVLAEARHLYRPSVVDVLDCLATDACGVDGARSFEEWADELGFDTDSRRAERTYHACREQATALRAMLGDSLYESLLYETERE